MVEPPALDRWDYAAIGSVAGLLFVAYVLVPNPTIQYAAWLTIFSIWMAWFVFFGAKWLYRAS